MNEWLAKAEAIFHDALELPAEERESFLQTACGDDAALHHEVAALLRASGIADEWLGDAACGLIKSREGEPPCEPERPGTLIGRYKLLDQIGEGGFGVVYMAEQQAPVRRKVALKIIKLGMDTRSVIARFEAERQALALLDHPNITKVLDAGATDTGRPYFVMELVRGVPITKFCQENQLDTDQRLELFIQVCGAIQHAHQKGIIHRDIKPTNVLVTLDDGMPHPMVIDFGVAKALNQRLTEKTLFTNFAQMIGTPAYMSPEQAEMSKLDVDTRSDIYSLGVLLYELLTGTTPFPEERLRTAGYAEMQRIICDEEPQKPSTRLTRSLVAAHVSQRTPQCKIQNRKSQLDHDLDWIVMKCLEKDRTRRYDTASALAADIRRHLDSEPILARPATRVYRLQKTIRRHTLAFAAVAAVAAALLLGVMVSSWQALRATRAERQQSFLREQAEKARAQAEANEQKAKTEAAKSQHVAQFMKKMLDGVGPSVALGRDTTMLREILDKTAERLAEDLKDEPAVEAELRHTIGSVHLALGEYNKAEQMFRKSLAIKWNLHDTNDLELAGSLEILAWVLHYQNQDQSSETASLLREALTIRTKDLRNEQTGVAQTLYRLAAVPVNHPGLDEVAALHRDALATHRNRFGEEHLDIALLLRGLGLVLHIQGKFNEAELFSRQSLAMRRKLLGENHFDVAETLDALCAVVTEQGKFSEAESLYRELVAMFRRLYGDDHPDVASVLQRLGVVLMRQRKWSEAEGPCRQALAMRRKFYGDHPDMASSLDQLGVVLRRSEPFEAESLHREAVAIRKKVLAKDHPSTGLEIHKLVTVSADGDRSETAYHQNLITETNLLANEVALAYSLKNLAMALRAQGKWDEAKSAYLKAAQSGDVIALDRAAWFLATCADSKVSDANTAVTFAEKTVNATERKIGTFLDTLAATYAAVGRYAEAAGVQQEAIALEGNPEVKKEYQSRLRLFQSNSPYLEYHRMAVWLRDQGKLAEAESAYRQELTMRRSMFGGDHPEVATSLSDVAVVLQEQGKVLEAEPLARKCLSIRERQIPDDWLTFDAQWLLGSNLLAQRRYAEAEPLLRSGYEGLKQCETVIPAAAKFRLTDSLQHLVQLYQVTGRPEKTDEWKKRLSASDKSQ